MWTQGGVGAMHKKFTYYAGIMLDAFSTYYAQNYASIIGAGLIHANNLPMMFLHVISMHNN